MSPVAIHTAPRRNPDLVIEPVPWTQEKIGTVPSSRSSGTSSSALQNLSNVKIDDVRPHMQRNSRSPSRQGTTMYSPDPDVIIQGVGSPEPHAQFPNMRYPAKFERATTPVLHDSTDSPRRSPALRSNTEPPMPPTAWRQSDSPRSFYYEKTVSVSPVHMAEEVDKSPRYDKMWLQAQEKPSPRVAPSDSSRDFPKKAPSSPQLEDSDTLKALCGEENAKPKSPKKKHARKLSAEERASVFQELFPPSPYNSEFEFSQSQSTQGSMSSNRSSEDRPGSEGDGKKIVRFEARSTVTHPHPSSPPPQTSEKPTDGDQDAASERSSPVDSPMIDARRNLPSNQRRVSSPKTEFPPVNWPFAASSPRQFEHNLSPEEALYTHDQPSTPVQTTHRMPFQNARKLMDAGFENPVRPDDSEGEYVQIGYRPTSQDIRSMPVDESEMGVKSSNAQKSSVMAKYRPPFQDNETSIGLGHGENGPSADQPDESMKSACRPPFQDAQPPIDSMPNSETSPSSDPTSQPVEGWPKTSAVTPQSLPRDHSGTNLPTKADIPKHPLSISQLPPPTPPPQLIEQTAAAIEVLAEKKQRNRLKKRGQSLSEGKSSKTGTFEVKKVRRVTTDVPDEIKASLAAFILPKSVTSPPFPSAASDAEVGKRSDSSAKGKEKAKESDMPLESPIKDKPVEKPEQKSSPAEIEPKSDSKFKLTSAIASYYKPTQKNGIERSKTIPAPPTSYPNAAEKPTKPRRRSFRTSGLFGSASSKQVPEDSQNESKTSISSLASDSSLATPTGRSPLTSRDSSPMRQNSDPTSNNTKKLGSPFPFKNMPNIKIESPSIPPIPSIPTAHRTHSPNRSNVPLAGSSGTVSPSSVSRQGSKSYPPPPDGHQWVSSADLAAFNNSGSEVIIFRRFDAVHKRVLLDMTDKIVSMEAELQQLDTLLGRISKSDIAESSTSPLTSTSTSTPGATTPSSSTPNDAQMTRIQQQNLKSQRRDLLASLKSLLNDYDDMLLKFDSLRVLSPIEQKAGISRFKNWLNKNGSSIPPPSTTTPNAAAADSKALTTSNQSTTTPSNSSSSTSIIAQLPLPPSTLPSAAATTSSSSSSTPRPTKPTRASTVPLIQVSPSSPPSSSSAATKGIPTSDQIDPQVRRAAAAIMAGKATTPPPPLAENKDKENKQLAPATVGCKELQDSNAARMAGEKLRDEFGGSSSSSGGGVEGDVAGNVKKSSVIRKVNNPFSTTSTPRNARRMSAR